MSLSVKLPLFAFLLALGLAIVALPAAAQQDQLAPVLTIGAPAGAPTTLSFKGNDTTAQTLTFVVQNSGRSDAASTMAVARPPGWSISVSPESFIVSRDTNPSGGSPGTQTVIVTVQPILGQAHNETVTLSVSGTAQLQGQDASGVIPGDSASTDFRLSYTPPPPPPPPPPYDYTPMIVAISAAVLVLLLVVLYLVASSRVRLKVSTLEVADRAGDRVTFSLLIENPSNKARRIDLRLRGLNSPWAGALMVPHVLLDAKARTDIPITVNIPRDAAVGTLHAFKVQGRPHGPFLWLISRRLAARVLP